MKVMSYKSNATRIQYSDEDQWLIGYVAGIGDLIGFPAAPVIELRNAFEEALNDDLQSCAKLGREPQKT